MIHLALTRQAAWVTRFLWVFALIGKLLKAQTVLETWDISQYRFYAYTWMAELVPSIILAGFGKNTFCV